MSRTKVSGLTSLACALTVLAVAARFFPLPALTDAASGLPFPGARLDSSWGHLLLGPLSVAADLVVCASARQHVAGLFFLVGALWAGLRWSAQDRGERAWRAPLRVAADFAKALVATLLFWGWAALGPRPVERLVLQAPEALALDFHSHTSFSRDGRRSFSPEKNAAWHAARGYGAAFVSDHNTVAALERARRAKGSALLGGVELSLHEAHVLVYGGRPVEAAAHQNGPTGLERALRRAIPEAGGLAVMSLPEYWKHHDGKWEVLADWGARGFEIVSASPKALDFPPEARRRVVDLCRRRNLFMTGGTDNHGWASAACVWTVIELNGWRTLSNERLEEEVLHSLRSSGFNSTRVLVRSARAAVAQGEWEIWLDYPRALWMSARTWPMSRLIVVLAWIWFPILVARRWK